MGILRLSKGAQLASNEAIFQELASPGREKIWPERRKKMEKWVRVLRIAAWASFFLAVLLFDLYLGVSVALLLAGPPVP